MVQLQVKNSLMFIIWITEMVFSPQDQSQGWIRIRREDKAFQKVHRWGRAWEERRAVKPTSIQGEGYWKYAQYTHSL